MNERSDDGEKWAGIGVAGCATVIQSSEQEAILVFVFCTYFLNPVGGV